MQRKPNGKLLLTLLASAMLITGCSDTKITAEPTWNEEKIVTNIDVKENKMEEIFDAIYNLSSSSEKILNDVLTAISETVFGTYTEIKTVAATAKTNPLDESVKTFINAHEVYKYEDTLKITKTSTGTEKGEYTQDELTTISANKVINIYNAIQKAISKKFYSEAKSGTYSDRNVFYEEKFINNLKSQLYTIEALPAGEEYVETLILPTITEENAYKTLVHADDATTNIYTNYIERSIVPEIMRTLLVENYLNEQRYSILGRAYARKITMLDLEVSNDNKVLAASLLNKFASEYITNTDYTGTVDFELVADAWRGVDLDVKTDAAALLEEAGFKALKDKSGNVVKAKGANGLYTVYEGTKLGDVYKDYIKITNSRYDENIGVYEDFTNNYQYPVEVGLKIKEDNVRIADLTTSEWVLKNGGISNVSETIRERLFNIAVSNKVDHPETEAEATDYVAYFNGEAYLTSNISESGSDLDSRIVIYDNNAHFYIIQVNEAVSTSKLSQDGDNTNSYRYLKADATGSVESALNTSDIAWEICQAMAAKDTYKTNANQYYIMQSNVLFYDEKIYEYFKSTYPELFK